MMSVINEFESRAMNLSESLLASKQKMEVQAMNIKAYVTYSFPLALLTEADLAKLDGMNARLCKRINKLSPSTPTAMTFEDRDKAGVGLTSLQQATHT